jgi:hypothetical protein
VKSRHNGHVLVEMERTWPCSEGTKPRLRLMYPRTHGYIAAPYELDARTQGRST